MLDWRRFILVFVIAVAAACASPTSDSRSGDNGENDIGELGGMCGGIAGFQCDGANTFCKSEPGICVDQADYSGICTTKPEVCTMQYDPVCGCDGKTYGNACSAAGSGVSVAYAGPCEGDS